jgi:beta-glucosidase
VADANNNTIVVIHAVGPVNMPWIHHPSIKAVVWPGLPGQESGNALADVLFGDVNPSARLPYTIAQKDSDYGAKVSNELSVYINYIRNLSF